MLSFSVPTRFFIALILLAAGLLAGCADRVAGLQTKVRRPPPPPTDRVITVPVMRAGHVKYEPDNACFIGAYIQRDSVVKDSGQAWERLVGKGHASYLRYVGYGRPFPLGWGEGLRQI